MFILLIPPLLAIQVIHLNLVPFQGNVKVGGSLSSLECNKHTCVFNRVGLGDITDLKGHLERSSSLVTAYLHPNFTFRDHPVMPGQPVFPYNIDEDVFDSKLWKDIANDMHFTSHFALGVGTPSH